MTVEWKEVPGHEFFEVTRCGRVRTKSRLVTFERDGATITTLFKGKEVSPCIEKNGYYQIAYRENGKRKKYLVHRLVGFAFVPGHNSGYSINHIDGNKLNNHADNLEWVTLAQNTKHQWEAGLVDLRGEKQPGSKLTSRQVVYIRRLIKKGVSPNTLAVIANVCPATIYLIRDGKRWNWLKDSGNES